MIEDRSFLEPDLIEDPHPYLSRLRTEDPVHWSEHHQGWMLTRYDDVVAAFRDPRLSSARVGSLLPYDLSAEEREDFSPMFRLLANWMVFKDPPDHVHLRRLARFAFTTRIVDGWRPMVAAVVDELIDGLERSGRADFVPSFAYALPATVIAHVIGVPPEDFQEFKASADAIAPLIFGGAVADRRERAKNGLIQLEAYCRRLLARAKRERSETLLGTLSRAEEQGDVLSDDEVIATCILLLFAGHETTTSLLANGLYSLERAPEEKRRLGAEPSLARSAVEELLRYEGPSKGQVRIAVEDLELRGLSVRRGQRVFLVQAAANRDPERFRDPDRLDIGRADNDHLGFGYGLHHCLGAPLARLEGEIALRRLAERLPGLRVTESRPRWRESILARSITSLPVAVSA
ncbi:MAG: cytochrome P450 [Candidatus Binatia bacterium]